MWKDRYIYVGIFMRNQMICEDKYNSLPVPFYLTFLSVFHADGNVEFMKS